MKHSNKATERRATYTIERGMSRDTPGDIIQIKLKHIANFDTVVLPLMCSFMLSILCYVFKNWTMAHNDINHVKVAASNVQENSVIINRTPQD